MRLARLVRTFGLLLLLCVAGFGGGCGLGSQGPLSKEKSEQIRESKKKAHQQIQEQFEKNKEGMNRRGGAARGAPRGAM